MTGGSVDPAADADTPSSNSSETARESERDVYDDALDVTATDDRQVVEAAHVADNGEEMTLHFVHSTAYRSIEGSPVEEISFYASDGSDEYAD